MFGAGSRVTLIGLDVTHMALFTRAHADRLRDPVRAGRVVAELSDFFRASTIADYAFDGRRSTTPSRSRT